MSSAPTAAIDICNLALDHLGEPDISDIDSPSTDIEFLFARWYDHCRRKLLRSHNWNFATKFTTLARTGDGVGGYEDAYAFPANCLRIQILSDDTITEYVRPDAFLTEYEITTTDETKTINIDNGAGTLYLKYTEDITTVGMMDELFIEVFALELALKTAFQITKKKSEVERISALLTAELPKAISVDGQERPPRRVMQSKFVDARSDGARVGQVYQGFNYP